MTKSFIAKVSAILVRAGHELPECRSALLGREEKPVQATRAGLDAQASEDSGPPIDVRLSDRTNGPGRCQGHLGFKVSMAGTQLDGVSEYCD